MTISETQLVLEQLDYMDDTEFEHVYEMTKHAARLAFQVDGLTVGYDDALVGRLANPRQYQSPFEQSRYMQGFTQGARERYERRTA